MHALLAVVEERLGASIMLLASFSHPYRVPFEMKAARWRSWAVWQG
jgi:hypothetical protein